MPHLNETEQSKNATILTLSIDRFVRKDNTITQAVYGRYMQTLRTLGYAEMISDIDRRMIEQKLNNLNR